MSPGVLLTAAGLFLLVTGFDNKARGKELILPIVLLVLGLGLITLEAFYHHH